ncbi:MAG: DMT family transporter [Desulfovibrionaceae bacterium]
MKWFYLLLALVSGALVPLQAGVNVRLRQALGGDAVLSALISFAGGTLVLLAVFLAQGANWPRPASDGPWWMWTGGIFGAFFVAATIVLAQRLGATSMLAWILASQLLAGLVLDQFGVAGYAVRDITWPRLAGVALLLAGAWLVERF